jgi:acyl carrier protein
MNEKAVDVRTFIRNLARDFEGLPPDTLDAATRFVDLPDWTSLQALIVAASFEHDYGVTVSADDFRRSETIGDLHGVVLRKLGG